jgi:plasmid replication initiation protein
MAAVSTTRAKPFSIDCNTITVKVVRNVKGKGDKIRRMAIAEAFITRYRTVADAKSGRVATVEMEIADWIYEEVAADSPMVLTMHPDISASSKVSGASCIASRRFLRPDGLRLEVPEAIRAKQQRWHVQGVLPHAAHGHSAQQ